MPRKRCVTREIDVTVANCLYVNPKEKKQTKKKITLPGVLNPRQIDRKQPLPHGSKGLLYVKCLSVKLARIRYALPIADYMKYAEEKEIYYYGEDEKKKIPNENKISD